MATIDPPSSERKSPQGLDRDELQQLEFLLRPHLRPRLFGRLKLGSELDLGEKEARGRLIDLVCQFRTKREKELTASEICESAGLVDKAGLVDRAVSSQFSRFRRQPAPLEFARVADKLLMVLLLGNSNARLTSSSPADFKKRDWQNEEPIDVASRILKLFFGNLRERANPKKQDQEEDAGPNRDDLGFFQFREDYAANTYEAVSGLNALAWLTRHAAKPMTSLVVRVSDMLPFPQMALEDREEHEKFGEWRLTRSGKETINFLAAGDDPERNSSIVLHVVPAATCKALTQSIQSFHQELDRTLGAGSPARKRFAIVRIPNSSANFSVSGAGEEAASGDTNDWQSHLEPWAFFQPFLRYVYHGALRVAGTESDSLVDLVEGWDLPVVLKHNKVEQKLNLFHESVQTFPNMFVQRQLNRLHGPTTFRPNSTERKRFEAWLTKFVLPLAKEQNPDLKDLSTTLYEK